MDNWPRTIIVILLVLCIGLIAGISFADSHDRCGVYRGERVCVSVNVDEGTTEAHHG